MLELVAFINTAFKGEHTSHGHGRKSVSVAIANHAEAARKVSAAELGCTWVSSQLAPRENPETVEKGMEDYDSSQEIGHDDGFTL